MIRVGVVEDETLLREAMVALLSLEADFTVIGQAGSVREAGALFDDVDVLLLDHDLGDGTGIDVLRALTACNASARAVMVTRHARPGVLKSALEAGATGFLPKDASSTLLAEVIRTVHGGGRYVDPELASDALALPANPLTNQERLVLGLVRDNRSTADLAELANLAPGTVRNYLSTAMVKLNATNRAEAARLASDQGWI